ncbi:MAG TPA: Stp1/IreP family PP2C-type Ser/Thr phosphatase [Nitrospira sp.]|nr:Stp1/IreP family PP2C-type Ser/Thr phosphatase [Nitrospira sp.]
MNRPGQWIGTGRTDTGKVRPTNQDAFAVLNDCGVWIVADGMGGHPAGDVAARMAVISVSENARRRFGTTTIEARDCGRVLVDLIADANREILEQGEQRPVLRGMGTTIVAMLITSAPEPVAHIAHLGDSRAYVYRYGKLIQLTRDHTLVEEYLRTGSIDIHEAKAHPKRHVLTRALGIESDVQAEQVSMPLQNEDVFLLCSDGLTKMLSDEAITSILADTKDGVVDACDALIDSSLEKGGEDNVTVVVCARRVAPALEARAIDNTSSAM